MPAKSKTLHFKTNAQLKSIIGKDLINDDYVAVLELVKNSFDALSDKVIIKFENIINSNTELTKLIIQDFGVGMDDIDIENKWLNIAYSEKKEEKRRGGRVFAGNKGVGRFSCDRLGKQLNIYTKTKKSKEIVHLAIDWLDFEEEGKQDLKIQDIKVEVKSVLPSEFKAKVGYAAFDQGTLLEILDLRAVWDYDKLMKLKKNLEKLINPNEEFNKSKFEVFIEVNEINDKEFPEHEKINGPVENKVFEKLNFKSTRIDAVIDKVGKTITTTLNDKGVEVFKVVEKNTEFSLIKDAKITLYYLNPYAKAYFTRQTGIKAIDFGSIFLFINGFRIPPYGDSGNDWLGLELRKGQGHSRYIGARELLGRIEIDDSINAFQIISNRAGVAENAVYGQLTKEKSPFGFYYKTHRRLERYVVEGLKWDSAKTEDSQLEKLVNDPSWTEEQEEYEEDLLVRQRRALNNIIPIINAKKSEIISLSINTKFVDNVISEEVAKKSQELNSMVEEIASKDYSSQELEKVYHTINSKLEQIKKSNLKLNKHTIQLGEENILAIEKSKEIETEYSSFRDQIDALRTKVINAEKENQRIKDELELEKDKTTYLLASQRTLSNDAKGLIHNVKLTSKRTKQNAQNLYNALREDRLKKNQALKWLSAIVYNSDKALKISNLITRANFKANSDYQDVDVIKYVIQYFDLYNSMYEDNKLQFKINSNKLTKDFIKRISILDLSLILDDLISNAEKAKAKTIQIDFNDTKDNDLIINFSDDGKGVADKFLQKSEALFDLGVTTTDGSGIGLDFVRQTLKKMNGKIKFIGNGVYLKGASFEVSISKSYK